MTPVFPPPRRIQYPGGTRASVEPHIRLDTNLAAQNYRLVVDESGITLAAADDAGIAYALDTLRQLTFDGSVPYVLVEDGPDIEVRGIMLDISRDKVPTMETLEGLVDRMSAWRMNLLMLYIEHTYAYAGFDEVWQGWSPLTAEEVRDLDRMCTSRGVELVIQQNCLGHMEKWLCHERFAPLAAIPGGWRDDRGHSELPTTLDPRLPESRDLVRELLRQQAVLRPSAARIHVGLDEPFDLNPQIWERIYAPEQYSDSDVGEVFTVPLGVEAQTLWTEWLAWLKALPELSGREVLAWADVVSANPETASAIPDGVTLVEWGYESYHPFDERCAALADAGLPFWVCCGTSGWSSLAGRPTNARLNIDASARAAVSHGGRGIVVADWGDRGHVQQLVVAEPAFAWAAARGWRHDADLDWEDVATRYAFRDGNGDLGRIVTAMGDAYRSLRPQVPEVSVLLTVLAEPGEFSRLRDAGLTDADLAEVSELLSDLQGRVRQCAPDRSDSAMVVAEVVHTLDWLQFATRIGRYRLAVLAGQDSDGEIGRAHV